MTDGNNVEHLSVVMTTETNDDITQTTAANVITSSSSRGIEFYFQCAIVVIGVVGTAANALILYAMVSSKQHKKHVLIFHQNVLDLFSSLLLVITYAVKLRNIYLTGVGGYWLCMLLLNENILFAIIFASKINLIIVTIERYLKVVYPIWSKSKLRKWMKYLAMASAWICGFVQNFVPTWITSDVIGGVCYGLAIWKSRESQLAYGIWTFITLYAIIIVVIIFCYWRILAAIRRQALVMAGHNAAGSSTAQTQSNQIQTSVIKTMIVVSVFYVITDTPMYLYYLLMNINANLSLLESGYYATLFISFFYFCANPFIYAIKFDPVKRVLLDLIPCMKTPVPTVETVSMTRTSRTATRTGQSNK